MAHRKKILDKTKGQKDPTQAAAPSAQKYRYPIEKGLAKLDPKTGADGEPLALTEYGRRFSGPTSVAVADSDAMADFDIAPTGGDAALANLKTAGHGEQSDNAISDQLRKVDPTGYAPAHGAVRQQDPEKVFGKAKPSLP
jgi:hypothetical protein